MDEPLGMVQSMRTFVLKTNAPQTTVKKMINQIHSCETIPLTRHCIALLIQKAEQSSLGGGSRL